MIKIFPTIQIKELDAYTIENEPVTSIDLMERASQAQYPNVGIRKLLSQYLPDPETMAEMPLPFRVCWRSRGIVSKYIFLIRKEVCLRIAKQIRSA